MGVSNHQPHDCLHKCLFRRRSKKISKPRVTGLCEGNSPVIGEFPAQRACNAKKNSFDDVIMAIAVRLEKFLHKMVPLCLIRHSNSSK